MKCALEQIAIPHRGGVVDPSIWYSLNDRITNNFRIRNGPDGLSGGNAMGDYLGVKDSAKQYKKLREMAPDMMKGFLEFDKAVFKDGAIPSKTKELMAITAAHVTQCPWCIDAHVTRAKEKGCTDQEIAEAVWVAAAMRAGAAFSHGALAMEIADRHQH
jgi:AhpD family alkylhydroperoxidase